MAGLLVEDLFFWDGVGRLAFESDQIKAIVEIFFKTRLFVFYRIIICLFKLKNSANLLQNSAIIFE